MQLSWKILKQRSWPNVIIELVTWVRSADEPFSGGVEIDERGRSNFRRSFDRRVNFGSVRVHRQEELCRANVTLKLPF